MAQLTQVLLLSWRDTTHPQGGGSEQYLERVGERLASEGVEVVVRTARHRGSARSETRDGMRFSRGGGRLTVYPRALAALALARIGIGPLAGFRPDVIVDTHNGMGFFARLATRAPVVVLVHHCHKEQWPVAGRLLGALGWWLESVVSPWVHRRAQYLTVSLPSLEGLVRLGVDRERAAVVRAGVDRVPAGAPVGGPATRSAQPTLCVLTRLVPHKRVEDVLDALAALRADGLAQLRLEIVGDGWWADNLRRRADELAVADAVVFHGRVDEARKHEVLARAWLHVMPSLAEGWGLAVIEAAQHGVPTVGYTGSGGLTDSILDGVTGVLVDGPEDLARVVRDLIGDHRQREALGEKARRRAREFSWAQTAAGVRQVLEAAARGELVSGLVGPANGR
ncbi:glycosyl transferase group 1 [Segniliparus rotundus DSM 44985]|uniref:Glycosyl transferase group 1 n=1 Tax=Segniliparus rotundus (strain ATCC BAA-972 / CDC 1076 / CIP 108378 / DSM 44985 / JCM 13578) TaxID=640132 RepID=D6ZB33_SEGRD|nr:glycosyltransferase family 4 protein [Segniliparus rotundus]ADG96792.1 glycosyl transferase group 1 [Segniliparus rotundus DSM 44985]